MVQIKCIMTKLDVTLATQAHRNEPRRSQAATSNFYCCSRRILRLASVSLNPLQRCLGSGAAAQEFSASQDKAEPALAAEPKIRGDTDTPNTALRLAEGVRFSGMLELSVEQLLHSRHLTPRHENQRCLLEACRLSVSHLTFGGWRSRSAVKSRGAFCLNVHQHKIIYSCLGKQALIETWNYTRKLCWWENKHKVEHLLPAWPCIYCTWHLIS